MLAEALRHPITHTDPEMMTAINAMHQYMPQLPLHTEQFGQDFVDCIKPVHHVTQKWEPLFELCMQVNVRYAAIA